MHELSTALPSWGVADLVRMDRLEPGVIARVLTASPMRRQAIFMAIANRTFASKASHCDERDARLAGVLCRERAREIVRHALGTLPNGLLGALERLGEVPLASPRSYARLFALFVDERQRRKAEALKYVGRITEPMLRILDVLDPRWIHTKTLERLESPVEAVTFNRALGFAQAVSTKATDEAVAAAIAQLPAETTLAALVKSFVRRADRFPDHPVKTDDGSELRALTTVRDFVVLGRGFHNCLAEKIDGALVGRAAYAVFQGKAILEFRPLSDGHGWILWEVHSPHNEMSPRGLLEAAANACTEIGIPHIHGLYERDMLAAYRRFTEPGIKFNWPD